MAAKSAVVEAGQPAPDFSVDADDGQRVTLSALRGRKVVLYFYPKDDTPGCTKEACSFRDGASELRKLGAVVYGVSGDTVASHEKFKRKHALNFPLLSDPDHRVAEAYGVWKQKLLYGRSFLGIERTTFLIDEEGRIAKIFPKVKVDGHFDEVLEALV